LSHPFSEQNQGDQFLAKSTFGEIDHFLKFTQGRLACDTELPAPVPPPQYRAFPWPQGFHVLYVGRTLLKVADRGRWAWTRRSELNWFCEIPPEPCLHSPLAPAAHNRLPRSAQPF
jgi:hypothetical protein